MDNGTLPLDDFGTAEAKSEKEYQEIPDKITNQSLTNSKYLEKSLCASRDHVFLTWHDINFDVPIIQQKVNEA